MVWVIGASAGLVSTLFVIYLYRNAAGASQFIARRFSRPEASEFHKEEYAWLLLVVLLVVVVVLLLPTLLDFITRAVSK